MPRARLQNAIYFVVPGQRTLVTSLEACTMDGGRVFAAAFAWLLAIIYLASATSRLKLQAGLIRLEAGDRPQPLGPTLRAFLFGIVAVVGIQFLFVGSAYPWLQLQRLCRRHRGPSDRAGAPDAGLSDCRGPGLAAGLGTRKTEVISNTYMVTSRNICLLAAWPGPRVP